MARIKKRLSGNKLNKKKRYFNMPNPDVGPSPRRTRQRKRNQAQSLANASKGSVTSNASTNASSTTVASAELFYIDTTPSIIPTPVNQSKDAMQSRDAVNQSNNNTTAYSTLSTNYNAKQLGNDSALNTTVESSINTSTKSQLGITRRTRFKKRLQADKVRQKYQNFKNNQMKKSPFKKFAAVSPAKKQKKIETKSSILRLLGDKSCEIGEIQTSYENDANLLQDLDLVVLAASPADYENYTKLLRQEYANMNDESYKQMRLKVLEALLMIPNIFSTPDYQAKFEQAARNNIKWEINYLKSQGN